jgi:hypothetical protein
MPDFIAVWVPATREVKGGEAGRKSARTLDLRDVEESSRAADQPSAGEGELGDRLITSLVESSSAVCNALAAFEQFSK